MGQTELRQASAGVCLCCTSSARRRGGPLQEEKLQEEAEGVYVDPDVHLALGCQMRGTGEGMGRGWHRAADPGKPTRNVPRRNRRPVPMRWGMEDIR